MGKKIVGIVLILAALGCVAMGFKAQGAAPENLKIVENAVVVSDGKVLPENEGKIVIVQGELTASLPFTDPETGVSLNSIAVLRNVDKLMIKEDTQKEAEVFDWMNTLEDRCFGGSERLYAPDAALGEFLLEKTLMDVLSITEVKDDYTDADKQAHGFGLFTDDGVRYLYQGEKMPDQDDKVTLYDEPHRHKAYRDYVETCRVSYKQMDMTNLRYTIIGLQDHGTLRKAAELDMKAVHAGTLGVDELKDFAQSSAKFAQMGSWGFAVVLAAIGVLMFVRAGKVSAAETGKNKKRT